MSIRPAASVAIWRANNREHAPAPAWMLYIQSTIRYQASMILSYRDSRTQRFAEGRFVKAFGRVSEAVSLRLQRLQHARSLDDLAAMRGNRLEALKGKRRGQYSIRINDQWRICFEWRKGEDGPSNVEIVDYH